MIRTLDACKLSKTLNLFMVKIWDFPNHILGLTKIQYPFHTLFRSCIIISYLVQADTNSAALFRIWFRRLLLPTFPRPFPLSMLLCAWMICRKKYFPKKGNIEKGGLEKAFLGRGCRFPIAVSWGERLWYDGSFSQQSQQVLSAIAAYDKNERVCISRKYNWRVGYSTVIPRERVA